MRKLWQTKWFGIQFNDFIDVDSVNIADEKFYEKFYEKFKSFDDLPKNWVSNKLNVAKDLLEFSKDYDEVLSIGCGNGIIEDYISNNSDKFILAIEPSNNSRWIENRKNIKFISGLFPKSIKNEKKYQFGYCSSIDYVFNDEQYGDFFKIVFDYEFDEFYLTEIFVPNDSIKGYIKLFIKQVLSVLGIYNKGQFWGYLRTIDEHLSFLKGAGFKKIEHGQHKHGSYWIKITR